MRKVLPVLSRNRIAFKKDSSISRYLGTTCGFSATRFMYGSRFVQLMWVIKGKRVQIHSIVLCIWSELCLHVVMFTLVCKFSLSAQYRVFIMFSSESGFPDR